MIPQASAASSAAGNPSLFTRIGRLAYRALEAMTESAYRGFLARQGYRDTAL